MVFIPYEYHISRGLAQPSCVLEQHNTRTNFTFHVLKHSYGTRCGYMVELLTVRLDNVWRVHEYLGRFSDTVL